MAHQDATTAHTPIGRVLGVATALVAVVAVIVLAFAWPAVTAEPLVGLQHQHAQPGSCEVAGAGQAVLAGSDHDGIRVVHSRSPSVRSVPRLRSGHEPGGQWGSTSGSAAR